MPVSFRNVTFLLPHINDVSSATWSVTWSDINADGRPDLYVNNHADEAPMLFLSWGDRHFGRGQALDLGKDVHAAVWADYDGDGFPELLERVGGGAGVGHSERRASNNLFEFEGGRLELADDNLGLAYPLTRGRGATPFDFNADGRLDVFLGAGVRPDGEAPATVMLQEPSGRYAADHDYFGTDMAGVFAMLPGHFDDDLSIDFAMFGRKGVEVLTHRGGSYQRTLLVPDDGSLTDFSVDDFNNDGRSDIWVSRALPFDQLARVDDRTLRFEMVGERGDASTDVVSFRTDGPVTLRTAPYNNRGPEKIVYGSESIAVDPVTGVRLYRWSEAVMGRPDALDEDGGRLLGVWYDPDTRLWHVEAGGGRRVSTSAMVESASAIQWAGYNGRDEAAEQHDLLFLGQKGGTFRETRPVASAPATSVASGDFDNDGDVDVYAVVTGGAGNLVNRLYLNDGHAGFSAVSGAGRAPGPARGIGDTTTSADFNDDGWLDLLVSNGRGPASFLPDSEYALYQNAGGRNRWLDVTLRAEEGDPVTLGSTVTVRSATGEQMQIYDAGVRLHGQDDPDLHFGLARAGSGRVTVRWPDNETTVLNDVEAGTRLTVWRGSDRADVLAGSDRTDVLIGAAGADRLQGRGGDDRLFGGNGPDHLAGGPGNDRLMGGWGYDDLVGGLGHDLLSGGPGVDRFLFTSVAAGRRTEIIDFEFRTDHIDLRRIDADPTQSGDQGFHLIWAAPFSGTAGDLRYADGVLAGDVDGNGVADFRIWIDAPIALTDFLL